VTTGTIPLVLATALCPNARLRAALLAAACCTAASCSGGPPSPSGVQLAVIPVPVSLQAAGSGLTLSATTRILTPPGSPEAGRVGDYLAAVLRRSTGFPLPVSEAGPAACRRDVCLALEAGGGLGDEGYRLEVSSDGARLVAAHPAGLFRGIQTIRQLLPARVERATLQAGPWTIPGVGVVDHPRFAWRGVSLDVARHFLTVAEVERYVDLAALYKVNVLHLHLTDDQGWRIAIDGWPRLTEHGGSTEVGGGPGGWYSQADYAAIVHYAQDRYVTVVPEIDVPGHTNAALASYGELSCDGQAPPLYTDIGFGFSALCPERETTYTFLDQVIGELARLTPGPYIHVGGDESPTLSAERYAGFMERVQRIVQAHGKRAIGWQEITRARMVDSSIAQFWDTRSDAGTVREAARRGTKLVLSPATRAYLDMKYDPSTAVGLKWAGYVEVRDAYEWDPATLLPGVGDGQLLGVEAAIWGETIRSFRDVEFLAFPRLPGLAEVGWSPARARDWTSYRQRLAQHGPRLTALGVDFYRSPQVAWA
jgi:hexosaminidase